MSTKVSAQELQLTSEMIARKTSAFLKQGGSVERVPVGKSGQTISSVSQFKRSTVKNRKPPTPVIS